MSNWHQKSVEEALRDLGSNVEQGLDEAEVKRRQEQYGPNQLIDRGGKSPWRILWEQLTSVMVIILIIAALISAVLGDYKDAAAIAAIVVLNTILGFSQEYRAEKAMAALKKLAVPMIRAIRGGRVREVSATSLVPGDIILLEQGNLAPADCRLVESASLRLQEAALTGESVPVEKSIEPLAAETLPPGDRLNIAFMGTLVTYGHGKALVVSTGMETELGRIATMIQTVEREPTPLQRRLDHLGRRLAVAALLLVGFIFGLGWMRGEDIKLLFLTAVSIGVAAVPEGLPAVVTISLALGAQRMLKRQALIRKLPAVEALGSVTVICSDKTGTLTENRMTASVFNIADDRSGMIELSRDGSRHGIPSDRPALGILLLGGALCNDARLNRTESGPEPFEAIGDPTEAAMVQAAGRFGLMKDDLDRILPRRSEVPFTSERKRMSTVHARPSSPPQGLQPELWSDNGPFSSQLVVFVKGAVDSLIEISKEIWVNGAPQPLDDRWRERIISVNDKLAADGMRVLGVAFRSLDRLPAEITEETLERDLIFVGMLGMIDPARPEVQEAVATCKSAGIHAIMITGDHPLTARTIAREIGFLTRNKVLTGHDLAALSTGALAEEVENVTVFARVSPEHKLNIVDALKQKGHIVAMTGDGVNDAPALKKADIGIAMGITGTDVAKEASEMVLLDDNFATIVAAVREGRVIYDNARKFIKYVLTTNSGEIWVMILAPFLGMPLPLLPLQILWMNLVTDGLPALALGVEPAEEDVMQRPPHPPSESIFAHGLGLHIILIGLLTGLLSLVMGWWYWKADIHSWQTMIFTTLTFSQMAHVMAIRSDHNSLFHQGIFSNKPLIGAVFLTFVLQLGLIYIPALQGIFRTVPLSIGEFTLSILLSSIVFVCVEAEKWNRRRAIKA
ncbi:MAG: cation-translocating P-type ATPase [Acidobacteriota bacterium]|nr:MAG: cation-translocating P-type ATPase [Acidobacteriota bacterium]